MKTLYFVIITLLAVNIYSQDILTIGEVFDFEVDDEFHYNDIPDEIYEAFQNAERIKILDKSYSLNHDTLWYTFVNNSYHTEYFDTPEPHLEKVFEIDTQMVFYTNLDSSIYLLDERFIYDSLVKNSYDGWSYDTIITAVSYPSLCDKLINGFEYADSEFEPNKYIFYYGEGIGLTRFAEMHNPSPMFSNDKRLFYYRKGNITCGTPDLITSSNIINFDLIKIYPNPSSEFVYIEKKSNLTQVAYTKIYNSIGEVQLDYKIESDRIDISRLKKGLYIFQIQIDDKLVIKKIIKQ